MNKNVKNIVTILSSESKSFSFTEIQLKLKNDYKYNGSEEDVVNLLNDRRLFRFDKKRKLIRLKKNQSSSEQQSLGRLEPLNFGIDDYPTGIVPFLFEVPNDIEFDKDYINSLRSTFLKGGLKYTKQFEAFQSKLLDPVEYIINDYENSLSITEYNFKSDNLQFLYNEIVRDNRITEIERAFFDEKLKEYEEEEFFLEKQSNYFLAYPTFYRLVDEVCKDGIITETEMQFLHEKSDQYNVPTNIKNRMIKDGQTKYKIKTFLRESSNLKYLQLYLICELLYPESDYLFKFFDQIEVNGYNSLSFDNYFQKSKIELQKHLVKFDGFFSKHQFYLDDFIKLLEFDLGIKKSEYNSGTQQIIKIHNSEYLVEYLSNDITPLFSFKFQPSHTQSKIIINKGHHLYSELNNKTIIRFAACVIQTKRSMTNEYSEIFYNNLIKNLEIIE